jgi:hypothetical protein
MPNENRKSNDVMIKCRMIFVYCNNLQRYEKNANKQAKKANLFAFFRARAFSINN